MDSCEDYGGILMVRTATHHVIVAMVFSVPAMALLDRPGGRTY